MKLNRTLCVINIILILVNVFFLTLVYKRICKTLSHVEIINNTLLQWELIEEN